MKALHDATEHLRRFGQSFALVGGLAVSLRAEVRFTRDVDLALAVRDDSQTELLVTQMRAQGYRVLALVEHDARARLATVRLASPSDVVVDLVTASTGVEAEIVERATVIPLEGAGSLPVARAEELLAMKVLSYSDRRLQDRLDALNLIAFNPSLDFDSVRATLRLIHARGYDRSQDLLAKLELLLKQTADADES
jgi:predicted nucleotidyltransferase